MPGLLQMPDHSSAKWLPQMIWRSENTVMVPPNTTMMEAKKIDIDYITRKGNFSISLDEWRTLAGAQRLFMETNADSLGS